MELKVFPRNQDSLLRDFRDSISEVVFSTVLEQGLMPEVDTGSKYEYQLNALWNLYSTHDTFVVYDEGAAVAFCMFYWVHDDPHCTGKGLVQAVFMSSNTTATRLLKKHLAVAAKHSACDWMYTSHKIAEYTYRGKYNILRKDKHG